jgi:multidrug resistance efflux pump
MDQLVVILVSVGSSIVSATVVGVAASYLTFRFQFERHRSMDAERDRHITRWRDTVDIAIKDHDGRLDGLERSIVTREELDKAYNEMRAERQAMHQANQEALERIESKIELERKEARDDRQALGERVTEIAVRLAAAGFDERLAPSKRGGKRR